MVDACVLRPEPAESADPAGVADVASARPGAKGFGSLLMKVVGVGDNDRGGVVEPPL